MSVHARYARLDEFAADVRQHLHEAWAAHVPLIVTLEDRCPQVVDTVADLEIVHDALMESSIRPNAPGRRADPSPGCGD